MHAVLRFSSQTAMRVVDRLVDALCSEIPPQTTTRSEQQPLEPLEIELESNLHDLLVRVEASQAPSRARARGSKNELTEVDQSARVRHCPVHVQALIRDLDLDREMRHQH